MTGTADDLIRAALSETGYTESPAGSNRNKYAAEVGDANGQPWCASFARAMCKRAGVRLPAGSNTAYTPTLAAAFRSAGRWYTYPQRGALAFFDFPDSAHRIQHVGIVVAWTSSTVVSVDGNTSSGPSGSESNGGGVFQRTRPRNVVVGYGYPLFAAPDIEEDDMARTVQIDGKGPEIAIVAGTAVALGSPAQKQRLIDIGLVKDGPPVPLPKGEYDVLRLR